MQVQVPVQKPKIVISTVKENRHRRAFHGASEHPRRIDGKRIDDKVLAGCAHLKQADPIRITVKAGCFEVDGHPVFARQALL
jgi:hypothetical protein